MTDRAPAATQRLLDVMARLLGPDGCPWDRAQSHRSLVRYLLEEAHELADAIESAPLAGKPGQPAQVAAVERRDASFDPHVREELGDVLLQVVFHARIAELAGGFDFAQVADGLADKMIERHPHVFAHVAGATSPAAGAAPQTAAEMNDAWDRRKLVGRVSRLDGIPPALPALMLAAKVSSRAAKAGFEWDTTDDIFAKAHEEIEEFRAALAARNVTSAAKPIAKSIASATSAAEPTTTTPDAGTHADAELEFGDLLFSLVQLARWNGVDAETALRRSTAKFSRRFRHMERALQAQSRDPAGVDSAAWWRLWADAKADET
jgi:uncharacterized protein YabN with tetrapyrrole methylase and pyrophosphatase domain